MMTREEAEKELIAMLEEAEGGPSYSIEEVDAYMRELLHPKNQIYLTGDTHGQFERIISSLTSPIIARSAKALTDSRISSV